MQELNTQLRETISLAALFDNRVEVVAVIESPQIINRDALDAGGITFAVMAIGMAVEKRARKNAPRHGGRRR